MSEPGIPLLVDPAARLVVEDVVKRFATGNRAPMDRGTDE